MSQKSFFLHPLQCETYCYLAQSNWIPTESTHDVCRFSSKNQPKRVFYFPNDLSQFILKESTT